jgi:Na+/H+ antiporter NhaD/arsenite permease-like protein
MRAGLTTSAPWTPPRARADLAPLRAWLILAMASTPAGNLTIPGSVADSIVVEAAREERILTGSRECARVGVPVTGSRRRSAG